MARKKDWPVPPGSKGPPAYYEGGVPPPGFGPTTVEYINVCLSVTSGCHVQYENIPTHDTYISANGGASGNVPHYRSKFEGIPQ